MWHDAAGGEPFWAVTQHETGRAILRDPLTFSSARARGGMYLRAESDLTLSAGLEDIASALIETDRPRHKSQRRVLSPQFTPRSIAQLERQIRAVAVKHISRATDLGEFDFVSAVAHAIPAEVMLTLLGVPADDWQRLAELEHQMLGSASDGESPQASGAHDAIIELATYFFTLLSEREADPQDDLLSLLLVTPVDGALRSVVDLVGEAVLLLNGSLDTTRAAASAGGLLPLLQRPDELSRLKRDSSLLPTAIEEFVRWASPIRHVARTATIDTDIAGVRISAGERVGVWLGACNRDPAAFERPNDFELDRSPNPHLGFSYGDHFCLGTHVARLLLRVEFEEILRSWTQIELVGDAVGTPSNFVGGLTKMPIRVTTSEAGL